MMKGVIGGVLKSITQVLPGIICELFIWQTKTHFFINGKNLRLLRLKILTLLK